MTETLVPFDFDPFGPEMASDPYPHYRRLRDAHPVWKSPLGFWFLTRHADVTKFFGDRTLQRQYALTQTVRSGPGVADEPYYKLFSRMLFVLDDPEHRRIRRLLSGAFTPRRVAEIRPRAEAIANEAFDIAQKARQIDLVADLAAQLPVRVIGDLLGLPPGDQARVGAWADEVLPAFQFFPMEPEARAAVNNAVGNLSDYLSRMADQRRSEPRDDLLSALVHATTEDGALSQEEVVANAAILYLAGQETTKGGIGLAILSLHRNPDQLDILGRSPEILSNAVEELLRYDHPAHATLKVTTEPIDMGGVVIPANQGIVGYLGAALRDPSAFPQPDRLDLQRTWSERPVTFAPGPFNCLGLALARAEMEVALTVMLRRAPTLKLETLEPPYRPSPILRGPAELHATW